MNPDSSLQPYDEPSDLQIAGQVADHYASGGVFEDYVTRKSPETIRRQRADLRLFAYFLSDVAAIDGDALQVDAHAWHGMSWGLLDRFKQWMIQQGYSTASVNVRISTIKAYAELASKAGVIPPDQLILIKGVQGYRRKEAKHVDEQRDVTRVGTKKAESVVITKEIATWLKDQPDTPQGHRDRVLMCVLLDHGLRAGEVAGLLVENVDLKGKKLRFYRPKVDKVQTHKLTADTLDALKVWLNGDALLAGPLLRRSIKNGTLSKGGMTTRSITDRVRMLGAALGIDGLSAHDCRHFWATHAARSGTDSFALQEAGGWSSLAMPRRYVEAAKIANQGVKGFDED
jgi:integrase